MRDDVLYSLGAIDDSRVVKKERLGDCFGGRYAGTGGVFWPQKTHRQKFMSPERTTMREKQYKKDKK